MTVEEIKALQDQLAALQTERDILQKTVTEQTPQIEYARKIKRGLQRVNDKDKRAAEYVIALSGDGDPEPFWTTTSTESNEDMDDVSAMEKRLMAHIDKTTNDIEQRSQKQFEAVGNPLLAVQRERTMEAAKAWAATTYPTMNFEDFKAQLPTQAGEDAQSVLESLSRLQTYAKAFHADTAEQSGYARATQEHTERLSLEDALLSPQMGGTAERGVDGDVFKDVDKSSMQSLMIAQLRAEGASDAQLQSMGYPTGG